MEKGSIKKGFLALTMCNHEFWILLYLVLHLDLKDVTRDWPVPNVSCWVGIPREYIVKGLYMARVYHAVSPDSQIGFSILGISQRWKFTVDHKKILKWVKKITKC